MLRVSEIMTKNVISCEPHTSIREAARLMYLNGLTGLPVMSPYGHASGRSTEGIERSPEGGDVTNQVVGIVTEQDLVKLEGPLHIPSVVSILGSMIYLDNPLNGDEIEKQLEILSATTVEQVMTAEPVTISVEAAVSELVELFLHKKINPVPVLDGGKLVGIVSRADIVKMLAGDKDIAKPEWRSLIKRSE